MKLQRYDFPCGGILDAYMSEGGRFSLHSEAQARIEALEEALLELTLACEKEFTGPFSEDGEMRCADKVEIAI